MPPAWTAQHGSASDDEAYGLAVGSGVYVVGYTYGALSGANVGGGDYFVAKYDADGNRQ